jgi:SMEK domain-containing protein
LNNREISLKSISNEFANWELKISNLNSLNLYDANFFSEHSICELLNCIFDYNLINTNAILKNHPAIDLGDKFNRISFQVTSVKSSKKIQETIDKFFENKFDNDYDELFIFILGKKQNKYIDFILPSDFSFNKNKHILDFRDLLHRISFLSAHKIKQINSILIEENAIHHLQQKKQSSSAKINKKLALKNRMRKDFLKELKGEELKKSWYEPWKKFKYPKVIIRSVDDKSYPEIDDNANVKISPWFSIEVWDFYDNGIELIRQGGEIIIDENNNWDYLNIEGDERKKNKNYKTLSYHIFLRIPFEFIVNYDLELDPIEDCPTLYVEYAKDGMPYEETINGLMGVYRWERFTKYLDDSKRVKLK